MLFQASVWNDNGRAAALTWNEKAIWHIHKETHTYSSYESHELETGGFTFQGSERRNPSWIMFKRNKTEKRVLQYCPPEALTINFSQTIDRINLVEPKVTHEKTWDFWCWVNAAESDVNAKPWFDSMNLVQLVKWNTLLHVQVVFYSISLKKHKIKCTSIAVCVHSISHDKQAYNVSSDV